MVEEPYVEGALGREERRDKQGLIAFQTGTADERLTSRKEQEGQTPGNMDWADRRN